MITIIGPRATKVPGTVNTTSHSTADWSRQLSLPHKDRTMTLQAR